MALRLLPWASEFGAGIEAAADPEPEAPRGVDTGVERTEWSAVTPSTAAPASVRIVDGVRRVEAHAMEDGAAENGPSGDRGPALGLFGSFAVGAVALDAGELARVLTPSIRLERCYLRSAGPAAERVIPAGRAELRFRPRLAPNAATPRDLVAALNRAMLDGEAVLAAELAARGDALVLIDGPLRLRPAGGRGVGYIKRIHQWYIGPRERALAEALAVGERTPLFLIEGAPEPGRFAWYARTADLAGRFHPLAGVVRMECDGALSVDDASELADQATAALPRLVPTPARDPRAPQNLLPVGALERTLTHRLGDRRWVRRILTASVTGETLASERPA